MESHPLAAAPEFVQRRPRAVDSPAPAGRTGAPDGALSTPRQRYGHRTTPGRRLIAYAPGRHVGDLNRELADAVRGGTGARGCGWLYPGGRGRAARPRRGAGAPRRPDRRGRPAAPGPGRDRRPVGGRQEHARRRARGAGRAARPNRRPGLGRRLLPPGDRPVQSRRSAGRRRGVPPARLRRRGAARAAARPARPGRVAAVPRAGTTTGTRTGSTSPNGARGTTRSCWSTARSCSGPS